MGQNPKVDYLMIIISSWDWGVCKLPSRDWRNCGKQTKVWRRVQGRATPATSFILNHCFALSGEQPKAVCRRLWQRQLCKHHQLPLWLLSSGQGGCQLWGLLLLSGQQYLNLLSPIPKVIILNKNEPDLEFEGLLKREKIRVKYFQVTYGTGISFLAVTWQLNRWPCHSLTDWLSDWVTEPPFDFWH